MKLFFEYRELSRIIENDVSNLGKYPTKAQKQETREVKEKDLKFLYYIHQSIK